MNFLTKTIKNPYFQSLILITFIFTLAVMQNRSGFSYFDNVLNKLNQINFHGPDWELLAKQSIAIKAHLFASLFAIALTLFQYNNKKGALPHKTFGWIWIISMTIVAISSLFVRELNNGNFSFIHLFTILTLVSVPRIVHYARTHQINKHKAAVNGLVFGGLLIAGAFTFMPGRLMWNLFMG